MATSLSEQYPHYFDPESDEFKELMELIPDADPTLAEKFLLDHNGCVPAAKKRYLADVEWRESDYFPITKEESQKELDTEKLIYPGVDIYGMPYVVFVARKHINAESTKDSIFRMIVWNTDRVIKKIEETYPNHPKKGMTLIVDCHNIGPKNIHAEFMKEFLDFFRRHYPSFFENIIVFNAGFIAKGIFKLVKPLLHVRIQNTMKMINGVDGLTKYIHLDQIPSKMGGNKDGIEEPETFGLPSNVVESMVKESN